MRIYYDGGDPMSFKEHVDSMIRIAQGQMTTGIKLSR